MIGPLIFSMKYWFNLVSNTRGSYVIMEPSKVNDFKEPLWRWISYNLGQNIQLEDRSSKRDVFQKAGRNKSSQDCRAPLKNIVAKNVMRETRRLGLSKSSCRDQSDLILIKCVLAQRW